MGEIERALPSSHPLADVERARMKELVDKLKEVINHPSLPESAIHPIQEAILWLEEGLDIV